ncbi:MAG: starch-binding protein [Bifidobacterium adolescentis]
MTGELPPDPVAKNTVYASKPSGWGKIYAYVYTGDGATAANNAAWPGVEMTAPSATDGCQQTDLYKYVVPDNLAKGAKVIFNDGGSQQYPGSREPGLDYDGGIVKWDGSSAALAAVECETTIPVTSVSISGDGVKDGKLSLKSGASVQLTATVNPSNATDRKVSWTSSDSSVANVMGTGVVTAGSKAGKATVTATAGGVSASVEVTVEAVGKQPMTVYYKPSKDVERVKAYWRVYSSPNATGNAQMTKSCDGWWKVTVPDTKGVETGLAFTSDGKSFDNDGGKLYKAKGSVASVANGGVWLKAPSCLVSKTPMTVYYKPSKTAKQITAYWRVYTSPNATGNAQMTKSCDGWWKVTVPDTKGAQTGLAFAPDGVLDNNSGKLYKAKGDTLAVTGGQYIPDVTPNCAVTTKQ